MSKKIKMLIVEDNEDERFFMKEGFIQSGLYDIVGEAENGNALQELLHTSSFEMPEIILSDLNMPGRNGYEVIVDIKTNSSTSHIPVIILTTAPLTPYAERCRKLGACAYFTKPDTFLEYREFAKEIYNDIKDCLDNTVINYSSAERCKERSIHKLTESCRSMALSFSNFIKILLSGKQQLKPGWSAT